VAAATLAASGVALLAPGTSSASSHREAPLTSANPLADNTDVYAFVSPDKPMMTTLIANWVPFQEPAGGPNFYPFGTDGYRYNIKVDANGDNISDTTYQWTFQSIDKRGTNTFLYNNGPVTTLKDANLLFRQTYTLAKITMPGNVRTVLVDNAPVAPSHVGNVSIPSYAGLRDEAITSVPGGGKSYAGQAEDPFFLDLRVFDLLYGTKLQETGSDTLAKYNVNSIALQVPTAELTAGGDGSGIVGVWSTTDQQTMELGKGTATPTGPFVQVSRLGAPLVNEVVVPAGLKDAFNSLRPEQDKNIPAVVAKVNDPEVPKLIEAIYGIPAPKTPRDDLFAAFLTGIEGLNKPPQSAPAEMLRLNTGIKPSANPNRLGVLAGDNAGFPNGRRLADDVVDIELQALEGAIRTGKLNPALTDKVDQNDRPFGKTFPYLALPTSGSSTKARGTTVDSGANSATTASDASATAPTGAVAAGAGGNGSSLPVVPAGLGLLGLAVLGGAVVLRRRTV
jgi:hypothetical protein